MSNTLATIHCPLCDAADCKVGVSIGFTGTARHGFRELRCPAHCSRYHMAEEVYAALPLAPRVATALATKARELAEGGTKQELAIDTATVRELS